MNFWEELLNEVGNGNAMLGLSILAVGALIVLIAPLFGDREHRARHQVL